MQNSLNRCTQCKGIANPGKKWCQLCYDASKGNRSNASQQQQTYATLCGKCKINPTNPGRNWCEQCFLSSKGNYSQKVQNNPNAGNSLNRSGHIPINPTNTPIPTPVFSTSHNLPSSLQSKNDIPLPHWNEVKGLTGNIFYINTSNGEAKIKLEENITESALSLRKISKPSQYLPPSENQSISSKCEQCFKSAMVKNQYLEAILTDCQHWLAENNPTSSHLSHDHILALVLLTYNNNNISIWNEVNTALGTKNPIWKNFLDLVNEALYQLPRLNVRVFSEVQFDPIYKQNGNIIEFTTYHLLTRNSKMDSPVPRIVLDFHLSRGYSLEDYAYSQDFKHNIVVMPGKFRITSPLITRGNNLSFVELVQN